MKIAVVTDNQKTISAHFERAQFYLVFTVENDKITGQELRLKANDSHSAGREPGISNLHFTDPHSVVTHTSMMGTIIDCDVLLARGMDRAAYASLQIRSIRPIITTIRDVQAAVDAYLAGDIIDHPERLH
jgi:predicted Fe-Mo cluster-binding NifX family protein